MSDKTEDAPTLVRERLEQLLAKADDVASFAVTTVNKDGTIGSMWVSVANIYMLIGAAQALVYELNDRLEKRKD